MVSKRSLKENFQDISQYKSLLSPILVHFIFRWISMMAFPTENFFKKIHKAYKFAKFFFQP